MEHGQHLTEIAIVVSVALACGLFLGRLRQPAIVGYILAGVVLGPSVLGFVEDREQIGLLAELGVLLLLFSNRHGARRRRLQLGPALRRHRHGPSDRDRDGRHPAADLAARLALGTGRPDRLRHRAVVHRRDDQAPGGRGRDQGRGRPARHRHPDRPGPRDRADDAVHRDARPRQRGDRRGDPAADRLGPDPGRVDLVSGAPGPDLAAAARPRPRPGRPHRGGRGGAVLRRRGARRTLRHVDGLRRLPRGPPARQQHRPGDDAARDAAHPRGCC